MIYASYQTPTSGTAFLKLSHINILY